MRLLVRVLPKIRDMFSGLKLKMEIKTTKKQLMSFRVDHEKLLEKYKTISP